MSDPVDERLRSYYRSIGGDPPAGLETRVARALDSAAAKPSASTARTQWQPAFGLLAAGIVVVIAALVFRNMGPSPSASPSAVTGPSTSASAGATESPSPSPTTSPISVPSATPAATPATPPTPSTLLTPIPSAVAFTLTGSMTIGRDGPTATVLKDGRVLVVGGKVRTGSVESKTATAELYDPSTGRFAATGSMADARWGHTATLLQDGRVLVTGGADLSDGYANLRTAELYDPSTGKFTPTGSMEVGRAEQTATLLKDGRVLIAGGTNSIGLASAEIYDPATGKFSLTGSMATARQNHAATLLQDGRVLIVGGTANGVTGPFGTLASAELYDPATGRFTATGLMTAARSGPTATLMLDGRVLVIGGVDQDSKALNSAELYDPTNGTFGGAGTGIPGNTAWRTATLLSDGTLLTVGQASTGAPTTAATWDGGRHAFYTAGTTNLTLGCQTATLLQNGTVLLLGGATSDAGGATPLAAAALYQLGDQN
jgi:hypothetical protein